MFEAERDHQRQFARHREQAVERPGPGGRWPGLHRQRRDLDRSHMTEHQTVGVHRQLVVGKPCIEQAVLPGIDDRLSLRRGRCPVVQRSQQAHAGQPVEAELGTGLDERAQCLLESMALRLLRGGLAGERMAARQRPAARNRAIGRPGHRQRVPVDELRIATERVRPQAVEVSGERVRKGRGRCRRCTPAIDDPPERQPLVEVAHRALEQSRLPVDRLRCQPLDIDAGDFEQGEQRAVLVEHQRRREQDHPRHQFGEGARAAVVSAQGMPQVQHSMSRPNPAGRRPCRMPTRGHGS